MILQTARLVLRKATLNDAPFFMNLLTEKAFIQNIRDHKIKNIQDAEKYITEKICNLYQQEGLGAYVVELKDTHIPIGICGIFKRENVIDLDLGFAILEKYQAKGYATEAAQAVMQDSRKKLNFKRMTGVTLTTNTGSAQVLKNLGFHLEKTYLEKDPQSQQTAELARYSIEF